MKENERKLKRSNKEKRNLSLSFIILGIIFILISFFFIPLMKNETRRFGEDVVVYDYFAMTLFYIFLIVGIVLIVSFLVYYLFIYFSYRKKLNDEN